MLKIPTLPAIIAAAVGFVIVPTILLLVIKNEKKLKITTYILTAVYFLILACGVLAKVSIGKDVISVVFDFTNKWASKSIDFDFIIDKTDLLLNIFMLIPIGGFCVVRCKNKKLSLLVGLLLGLATGFIIESLQFVLPVYRGVQLSDVILNGASVLIGSIYFYLVWLIRNKIYK